MEEICLRACDEMICTEKKTNTQSQTPIYILAISISTSGFSTNTKIVATTLFNPSSTNRYRKEDGSFGGEAHRLTAR